MSDNNGEADNQSTHGYTMTAADVKAINFERKEMLASLYSNCEALCNFQVKIFDRLQELKLDGENFYDITQLTNQINICEYFSYNAADVNLQVHFTRWEQLYSKIIVLNPKYHAYFVPLPKILASFYIVEGHYTRAVRLLYDAVRLRPCDMSTWFALLWWVVFLQDWNMLGRLLQFEKNVMADAARGDGYALFVDCCCLVYKLHTKECAAVANEIVKKLREICENDKRTFMYSNCKVLLRKTLMYAARIECISLSKIGDPLCNCSCALEACDLILHNRLPQFAKQEGSISEALLRKVSGKDDFANADEMLRIFSTVADYFELSQEASQEMLEMGLVREADSFCQTSWKHAILFGVRHRVIVSLCQIIYIRTVAVMDRELLFKFRTCVDALTTPLSISLLNINRLETNWRLSLQVSWASLMFTGYDLKEFLNFRKKCMALRSVVLDERKSLCQAIKASDMKDFLTPQFLELWILSINYVLFDKSAILSPADRDSYIDEALKLCEYAPLKFRGCYLLLRLLRNENNYYSKLQKSPALKQQAKCYYPPLTPSSAVVKPTEDIGIDTNVHEAYLDQKRFGHLFFRQWRPKNCYFLGRTLNFPLHKTLYLLEVATPAVRQCARMCQHEKRLIPLEDDSNIDDSNYISFLNTNFYFKETAQLSKFVSSLPKDITLVNLAIDNLGTLWLIRCHSAHSTPIVIPITNVTEDNEILLKMQRILDKNNESLTAKLNATEFWKTRRQLDNDIKDLVAQWQLLWFGALAPLLMPLAHDFSASQLQNIAKIEAKFVKTFRISREFAATIVRLCDHLPRSDWEALIKRLLAKHLSRTELTTLLRWYSTLQSSVKTTSDSKKYTLLVIPPMLNFMPWECLPAFKHTPLVSRIPSVHFFSYLKNKIKIIPKLVDGRNSYYVLNPGGDLANTEKRISVFVEKFQWNGVVGKVPSRSEIKNALAKHDLFLYVGHGSGNRYFGRSCIRQSDCRAVSVLMGCSSGCIQNLGPTFDGKGSIYEYMVAKCPCIVGCLWTVTDGEIDRFFIALMEYCFGTVTSNHSDVLSDEKAEVSAGTPISEALVSTVSTRRQIKNISADKDNKENVEPPFGDERMANNRLNSYRILVEGVTEARKICKLPYLTGASVVSYGLPIVPQFSQQQLGSNTSTAEVILLDE